jgi:large subunit ribosomal protein L5
MSNTASLKQEYAERIAPALKEKFQYSSIMQIPVLKKIVINQGLGMAVADKKIVDVAMNELTAITGQKAVATVSRKDIANFKLRKKMPIGVMVTLRRERMYEFLEKLVRVALPRIRDFRGITSKLDGRGNYTLGIDEQIIFPEINIDGITRILGMNITFVTTAQTDEEGFALLKEFGLPFKNANKD